MRLRPEATHKHMLVHVERGRRGWGGRSPHRPQARMGNHDESTYTLPAHVQLYTELC